MNAIRITHDQLRARARARPPGYLAEVLAKAATQDAVGIVLSHEAWRELRAKYGRAPSIPPPAWLVSRFAICQACPDSADQGFRCRHHTGCCFGRWRSDPAHACPAGRWGPHRANLDFSAIGERPSP